MAASKWTLLRAVEDIREPLGLKGTSIAILRAMISFVKADQISGQRDDTHICFASNAALSKRAHVSVQTVERHIAKLVSLGLLRRRSSANGKRWARRDTSGRVVLATGLSLLPLLERYAEFIDQYQLYKENSVTLTLLRDKCAMALARLKNYLGDFEQYELLLRKARNLLRRQPDQSALSALHAEITEELQKIDHSEPDDLMGTDVENEGHIETPLNPSVKEEEASPDKVTPSQMHQAYPKLCAELRSARNQSDCEQRMAQIAAYLGLGDLWQQIKHKGSAQAFMCLGYLLERAEHIRKPRSYAYYLLDGLDNGRISWTTLLAQNMTLQHV